SLDSGLQRFVYGLTVNYARRLPLNRHFVCTTDNRSFPVDGLTKCINNPAQHSLTSFDGRDTTCTLDCISFLNLVIRTEQYNPDVILLKVQYDTLQSIIEFNQPTGLTFCEAINSCNTVADLQDS